MKKAEQFFEAAETIRELATDEAEVADAYVTLCVHAGIAAADVVCCIELGKHAQGEDHNEAVALLGQVHSRRPSARQGSGRAAGHEDLGRLQRPNRSDSRQEARGPRR